MAIDKNFVVKHGLEVNTDLILANATTNQVGIATTFTKYTLHVNGGIGATNLSVTGVATFPQVVLAGSVSAASTTGISGQYLKSTGTGVVWENFPVGRTSTTFVAAAGQDTFNFAYAVGLIDVFVNGIKLTPSEFNASDGVSIVLNTTCFGGEVVDVHAYSVSGIGAGGTGITGLTVQDEGSTIGTPQGVTSINFIGAGLTASASGAGLTVSLQDAWSPTSAGINTLSNVGVGTTNPRFALEVGSVGYGDTALWVNGNARITGILTVGTSSIVLDGSTDTLIVPNLVVTNSTSGVIASGVGVTVRDGGGDLGSAEIIDFGDNLSVTFSSGIATITGSAGGGTSSQWTTTAAGIHTLSNVGIGTTNPTSALTVKGNTSLETLSVSGVSTFTIGGAGNTEAVYFQSKTQPQASLKISQAAGNDDGVLMTFTSFDGDTATIETDSNSNLTISAYNTLNLRGDSNIPILQSSGESASLFYSGNTKFQTIGAGVTVTGTTFTNQLSVSGISTLNSNVSVGGTISVDGGVQLVTNNPTIVGTSGTVGEIKRIGGAPFFYDGTAWREFVLSSGTPVSVPADTEWDNVILRATFDTDFTDAKFGVSPVYVGAGSSIVGAAVTIGTGAYRNDGTVGAGISYVYRNDYDFTGSWTFETWIYFDNGVSNDQIVSIFALKNDANTSGECALYLQTDGFANKYFYWGNENGASQLVYATSGAAFSSIFTRKWVHIALVRESDDGAIHFYINGVESGSTYLNTVIDNDILKISGTGLFIGGTDSSITINGTIINNGYAVDAIYDDLRISAGVGTAGQRYNSIGITTYATFTPATTALPTTGTLSSYVQPPGDKYGEIGLGTSPTWRGTSGVTVSQQSSGNYRVSFATTHTNSNDYYVLAQGMDQGFASYVGIARSTTHVDFAINKQSDDSAVDTGSLAVQIKNHV